jgi:hypothetical protein
MIEKNTQTGPGEFAFGDNMKITGQCDEITLGEDCTPMNPAPSKLAGTQTEIRKGQVVDPKFTEVPAPAADFFASLDSLRVISDCEEESLVEAVLSHVPVRKPAKEWFFRIHPEYSLDVLVLELKSESETLLVVPGLRGALLEEKCVDIRTIRLGVNRQGTTFLWPMRIPADGRKDAWATSAIDAAHEAESSWTRIQADMNLGAYRISRAKVDDIPRWPKEPLKDLLRIAFKGAVVDSLEHPTLKKLRGEV